MSDMGINEALKRIQNTEEASPVLVLASELPNCVDVRYAGTVASLAMLRQNHPGVLGVYHKGYDPLAVRRALQPHVRAY